MGRRKGSKVVGEDAGDASKAADEAQGVASVDAAKAADEAQVVAPGDSPNGADEAKPPHKTPKDPVKSKRIASGEKPTRAEVKARSQVKNPTPKVEIKEVGLIEWLRWKVGFPFRRNSWSIYLSMYGKVRGIVSAVVEMLLLVCWFVMYQAAASWLGAVRTNNSILHQEIGNGTAKKVAAVAGDGSLTTADGATYPVGSIETTAEVSHYFKVAYYSPSHLALLAPLDVMSIVHVATPVLTSLGATIVIWWFLRLVLTVKDRDISIRDFIFGPLDRLRGIDPPLAHDEKYRTIAYTYVPLSMRLVRLVTFALMVVTVAAWFVPAL